MALLYGVTGSGKTAVYLQLIARCLDLGKTALLLVPEIALTPQLLSLLAAHFGREVAVLHSSLPPASGMISGSESGRERPGWRSGPARRCLRPAGTWV